MLASSIVHTCTCSPASWHRSTKRRVTRRTGPVLIGTCASGDETHRSRADRDLCCIGENLRRTVQAECRNFARTHAGAEARPITCSQVVESPIAERADADSIADLRPTKKGFERRHCSVTLAVDVDACVRPGRHDLVEGRDRLTTVHAEVPYLVVGEVADFRPHAAGAFEIFIVESHETTVLRGVDVGFEIPKPEFDCPLECGKCVLGRLAGATAVGERNRRIVFQIAVHDVQICRPILAQYSSLSRRL